MDGTEASRGHEILWWWVGFGGFSAVPPLNSLLACFQSTMCRCSYIVHALMLILPFCGCASEPVEDLQVPRLMEGLPQVPNVPSSEAVQFEWPWCDVRVPPLSDCGEWGSVSDVGSGISAELVCLLAAGVKERLTEREWSGLPEFRVCRTQTHTWIRGDLPGEKREVWAVVDEASGRIVYDIAGLAEEEFVALPKAQAN